MSAPQTVSPWSRISRATSTPTAAARTPQDTTLLQRQIAAADKQIDQLVYQLYGLTDEEIALVEGAGTP